jgi:signal transduction histidine kinase
MFEYFYYVIDGIIVFNLLLLSITGLLKQGYKSQINRFFAAFCITSSIWVTFGDMGNDIRIPAEFSIISNRIAFSAGFAMSIFLMQFIVKLVDNKKLDNFVKYALWPFWAIAIVSATPLLASGVIIQDGIYGVTWGPLAQLYTFGLLAVFLVTGHGLFYGLRHSKGIVKRRLAATAFGVGVTVPLVMMFSLILPLITGIFWFNQFSATPALILVFSMYYGVVRYHLFDIKSASVRTLAYLLSMVVLVIIYYFVVLVIGRPFFEEAFGIDHEVIDILVTLGILFIFRPVKDFFDRLTNNLFYRGYYDSEKLYANLNLISTSNTDLRGMLEKLANEIAKTLKSEQAVFLIYTRDGHHVIAGTDHQHRIIPKEIMRKEEAVYFQNTYGNKNEVAVASLLNEDSPVRILMHKYKLEVAIPLMQRDMIGYLFLGDHRTSRYTERDIKVLKTLSDGLVVAVQNALSIREIQDMNSDNLKQRIEDATKELRKSNELLHQIDNEKNEFISIASHELRTPMTVIRGFVSLLERGQLGDINDKQREVLGKISNNAKTLIELVNNMLDLSKLESGKLEFLVSNNHLDELVEKSIDEIRLLYSDKGVELRYVGAPKATIKTDAEKFTRIMLNLLSNAYKFTPAGGSVTVTATVDKSAKFANICVADTGVGIPAESIGDLFKKFFQIDNYLQRQSGGTGLGLAISRQLVEKLGGTISVESKVGKGSKFCFTMPLSYSRD